AINADKPADLDILAPEIPPEGGAAVKPVPVPLPPKEDPKPVDTKPTSKEWKELASNEGRFTVLMPALVTKPEKHKKDKSPFGQLESVYYTALAEETKQVYVIEYQDLPADEATKGADAVL